MVKNRAPRPAPAKSAPPRPSRAPAAKEAPKAAKSAPVAPEEPTPAVNGSAPATGPAAKEAPPVLPEEEAYARKLEFACGHALSSFESLSRNGIPPVLAVKAYLRVAGLAMEAHGLFGGMSIAEEVTSGQAQQRKYMEANRAAQEAQARAAAGHLPS